MPQQQTLLAPSLTVELTPTLMSATALATAVQRVMQAGQVRDLLTGTNHRLLHVDNLFGSGDSVKRERNSFRAVIADYTNGRTVYASLDDAFGPISELSTEISNVQHNPNGEELIEAAEIAGFDSDAVCLLQMPPIIQEVFANGSTSRVINMLARNKDERKFTHVHVDMYKRTATTIREVSHAATTTSAAPACTGVKDTELPFVKKGIPGAAVVRIKQDGLLLWELVVIRPSSSSGTRGSGIELLNVRYRNKLLLKRAHVPILNVNYIDKSRDGFCGAFYRDWQWEEYPFYCEGKDWEDQDKKIIPNFRHCTTPSKTLIDRFPNGTQLDGGNFNGVAFDISNDEVVIRSQLTAGWYRYTSEWRLAANGTIMPRWGFGGVTRSTDDNRGPCVCVQHHHHVYWRFDFDIEVASNNGFKECDKPGTCQDVHFEGRREKGQQPQSRYWEISNKVSGNSFQLKAGKNDGKWNPNPRVGYPTEDLNYGIGDVWLANLVDEKFDDGMNKLEGRDATVADFSRIMGKSGIAGKDIVVWYSASFMHHQMAEHGESHVVGPDLVPVKWK